MKTKHTGSLPETTKRILRDRSEDNRARRSRIVAKVTSMLADASYFASGQQLEISRTDPKDALGDALEYLIQNAYPKMGFVKHLHPNPKPEIQSILRANDVEQVSLDVDAPEANSEALEDLREYVRLCAMTSKQIVLHELIEKRYGGRPYGWPELEVVLLVARLAVLKEINLIVNGAPLPLDQAYDHLSTSSKQRRVVITRRESADSDVIKEAQSLGMELFAEHGPGGEEALFAFLKERLASWNGDLVGWEPLAETGKYPGLNEIHSCVSSLRRFVEESDSVRFLQRFVGSKDELLDLAADVHELQEFYTNQRHSWEKLRSAVDGLAQNRLQLESHEKAGPALARMEEILAMERPYNVLNEVAELAHTALDVNDLLVSDARSPALVDIQSRFDSIKEELDKVSADDTLRKKATVEFTKLLDTAAQATSIAHIAEARQTADAAYDRAMTAIEEVPPPPKPDDPDPPKPVVKKRRVVEARTMWSSGFIETPEDIEAFLTKLRAELEAAIAANERVQIK